jgi:hypothetical protein
MINTEEVFPEAEMYTEGLPKHQDLAQKKRKTEDEKLIIETIKNPPSSPFNEELNQPRPLTESAF